MSRENLSRHFPRGFSDRNAEGGREVNRRWWEVNHEERTRMHCFRLFSILIYSPAPALSPGKVI
jgi:hypothetical protein